MRSWGERFFLEALDQHGIERRYAIELTGDICWRFYRQSGQGTRVFTSLITRDPIRRLRLSVSVNAFLAIPRARIWRGSPDELTVETSWSWCDRLAVSGVLGRWCRAC